MAELAFEYHPEAVVEGSEAYQWYALRSEEVAERFWQELRHARKSVTDSPETWNPYYHGTRCYRLHHFPYALVYIQRHEHIIGLAVAHLKRRPGYWRDRLKEDIS